MMQMKDIKTAALAGVIFWLGSICFFCAAQDVNKASAPTDVVLRGVGCLVAQDWIQRDLRELNLHSSRRALLRHGTGTIPGTSPETPGLVSVIFYAPDGKRGWMFFFRPSGDGKVKVIQNAYRLSKARNLWSASEGNGGIATYEAVGAFAGDLSKESPNVVILVANAQNCSSEP